MVAIKRDNVNDLRTKTIPSLVNACYDQKGSTFSLLGLSIKLKAKDCLNYLLIQENINVNKACDNMSPLMYATKYNQLETVKKLIKAGADPDIEYKGKTAAFYAKRYKRTEIAEFLASLK